MKINKGDLLLMTGRDSLSKEQAYLIYVIEEIDTSGTYKAMRSNPIDREQAETFTIARPDLISEKWVKKLSRKIVETEVGKRVYEMKYPRFREALRTLGLEHDLSNKGEQHE